MVRTVPRYPPKSWTTRTSPGLMAVSPEKAPSGQHEQRRSGPPTHCPADCFDHYDARDTGRYPSHQDGDAWSRTHPSLIDRHGGLGRASYAISCYLCLHRVASYLTGASGSGERAYQSDITFL